MTLNKDEYRIEGDGIWISKKAIENLRTHYTDIAKEKSCFPELDITKTDMWYYLGKRDAMIELLKHFESLKL